MGISAMGKDETLVEWMLRVFIAMLMNFTFGIFIAVFILVIIIIVIVIFIVI